MSEAPNHGSCVVSPVGLAALAGAFLLGGCGASAQSACATGCAAPLVCERAAPAGCQDPTWAAWPMPNAPADVATGAPTPMAYTIDSRNGTVTDLITSLMWQQAVGPNQQYTWREALAYCASLNLGGHGDWRLPAEIELVSVVNDSIVTPPTISATAFPDTPAGYYWSSIAMAGSPDNAWLVDFNTGSAYSAAADAPEYVRCVR